MSWQLAAVMIVVALAVPIVLGTSTDRGRATTLIALSIEAALGLGALLLVVH